MGNQMAVDYDVVKTLFEKTDAERAKVYAAINKIREEIEFATVQSNMWRGADATQFRVEMNKRLAQTYSIMKWLNRITWELKVYADSLKEQEQSRAEKIASSGIE